MPKKKPTRAKKLSPIPEDFPTISAHLTVADMRKAMEFYQLAFGFELHGEPMKMGKVIVHAVLRHGSSVIMLGGPTPDGTHVSPNMLGLDKQAFGLFVYVKDVDAHYKHVKRFKGIRLTPPSDMFWGDRTYDVVDRDGHHWGFGSRKAAPTPEQMAAALQAMMGG
ncbi:MAG: VOC family protein [bacterium]